MPGTVRTSRSLTELDRRLASLLARALVADYGQFHDVQRRPCQPVDVARRVAVVSTNDRTGMKRVETAEPRKGTRPR